MAYTVANLINDAYYASGIVSRDFQRVEGNQAWAGLGFLNDILTDKTIEKDMIPYYRKYQFNAVTGQEKYFIPNLEELETLVFFINNVRYQMREVDRVQYFGSPRANNVNSLPFNWHLERCNGGSNIYLYFFPNTNYPMEAWGQFRLQEVTMYQDLADLGGIAQLGKVTIFGTSPAAGILEAGNLVVNGVDLVGTYNTVADLLAYVNTGIIPNVTATYIANNFVFNNELINSEIIVATNGTTDQTSGLTFANFSLTEGPMSFPYSSTGYDRFYINYLKFSLAERLCTEYNFIVPPGVQKQLEQYQMWISKRSGKLDLKSEIINAFQKGGSFNWGAINLGKGWSV